jgi:hypothetical protein
MMLGEPGADDLASRVDGFERLVSSNLLEAETRAALAREGRQLPETPFAGIVWVLPERGLGPEITSVLQAGYVTGADLWHIASALWIAGDPSRLAFITLDERQRGVAASLGFRTDV